jgi:hypothetical protein
MRVTTRGDVTTAATSGMVMAVVVVVTWQMP